MAFTERPDLYQQMYDHLISYAPDSTIASLSEVNDPDASSEEKLGNLIGLLCLLDDGIELVKGVLSLEFPPETFDSILWSNFDNFYCD